MTVSSGQKDLSNGESDASPEVLPFCIFFLFLTLWSAAVLDGEVLIVIVLNVLVVDSFGTWLIAVRLAFGLQAIASELGIKC